MAATETAPTGRGANLADLVRDNAVRRGDAIAMVHPGPPRSLSTWAELDADVDAVAAGLRSELGLVTGDRVALSLSNSPAFVTAYFGVLRAGLVAVPLNTGYTSYETARVLAEADAKALLCEPSTQHLAEEAVAGTHRALVDQAGLDALAGAGRDRSGPTTSTGGRDVAVLLFTAGTSGRPKGAMLSHQALRANLDQCARLDPAPVRADDRVLIVLPLFHIYGLNAGLGMVARTGATAVLASRFDSRATLDLVRDEEVTNIPGAPPMYVAWSEQPELAGAMRRVRLLASGAAPLPPTVRDQIQTETGLLINEGYGLTETAPVVTSSLASVSVKPGSVGRPVPGVEVRLLDETGQPVEDGDAGEIWVRGDNLFSGYWPDGAGGPDGDGWFATGDVAYADEDGDLFLVDRRKELVLVSGFNVYPREVEEVIAEHAGVAEVAVIAVPHPSTGEAVKAYVVPRPGTSLTPEDVATHCAGKLARFKRPTIVQIVDALPHSTTGKVAKGRLRDRDENRAPRREPAR